MIHLNTLKNYQKMLLKITWFFNIIIILNFFFNHATDRKTTDKLLEFLTVLYLNQTNNSQLTITNLGAYKQTINKQ